MIVDTSALIAILRAEAERAEFISLLTQADIVMLSSGNWIELGAVLRKPADQADRNALADLMARFRIEIAPVTPNQARIGHEAYLIYGRGNHPARLNLGDCFAYALARETGLPLLFKGDDFSQTDIRAAA